MGDPVCCQACGTPIPADLWYVFAYCDICIEIYCLMEE